MIDANSQSTDWLPRGKRAAICLALDDVHPGKSSDPYEAGGDMGCGVLGRVEWLLNRHPALRATLFTTPDWREIAPFPTRRLAARIPGLRNRVFLAPVHPKGTMRLDRHPEFVRYLRGLPRTEIAFHGLHHVQRGLPIPVEFMRQPRAECRRMLDEATAIFAAAGLDPVPGMAPPAWNLTPQLGEAMIELGFRFVASACDVGTAISSHALTAGRGIRGVSLLRPQPIFDGRLVHIPTNVQATTPIDRVHEIIDHGGLISIKGHVIKNAFGHVALDGLDDLYRNYIDVVLSTLEDRYGDDLWWTSMGEISARVSVSTGPRVSADTTDTSSGLSRAEDSQQGEEA